MRTRSAQIRALEELCSALGLEAEIQCSGGEVVCTGARVYEEAWLLIIVLAWSPFLKKLAELAAEDAYVALKDFVRRAEEARRGAIVAAQAAPPEAAAIEDDDFADVPEGRSDDAVLIQDRDSGDCVRLSSALPYDAYRTLRELDFPRTPPGTLWWDHERQRWERGRA